MNRSFEDWGYTEDEWDHLLRLFAELPAAIYGGLPSEFWEDDIVAMAVIIQTKQRRLKSANRTEVVSMRLAPAEKAAVAAKAAADQRALSDWVRIVALQAAGQMEMPIDAL